MALCAALVAVAAACENEKDNNVVPNDNNGDTTAVVATVSVTSVSLSQTTAELAVGSTLTLTPTVLPESASNKKVTWTSSNDAVATVANGLVTAVAAGTADITVTTQDGNKTDTCAVTVATPVPAGPTEIGGVTWAAVNVDDYQTFAARPDMYTKFYQWNRGTAWAATGEVTEWNSTADNSATWTVNPCPDGWRLPTRTEIEALNNAGSTWVAAGARGNAVAGQFYGANHASCSLPNSMSNCVFLPACGVRLPGNGAMMATQGTQGNYWSATQNASTNAYGMRFNNTTSGSASSVDGNNNKSNGFSLRCVQ